MNNKELLKQLEALFNTKEVEAGFSSKESCISWANKVEPLLKEVDVNYHMMFADSAHKVHLPLSSQTLGPAVDIMKSQVERAIAKLKLVIADEEESTKTQGTPAGNLQCGPLANTSCNQQDLIKERFVDKNVFLDIPYSGYEDREAVLREVVVLAGLNPIAAKDRLTANALLCKVCREIQTCKYGISDISFDRHSVTYELGLMHGLGKKVCILLEKEQEQFSDIRGLDHIPYEGKKEFRIQLARWLIDNVEEANKEELTSFIEKEEKESSEQGETKFNDSSVKKKNIDDFTNSAKNSVAYGKNRLGSVRTEMDKEKFFFIGATPIPLEEESLDTEDTTVKDIIRKPSYSRSSGWEMDFGGSESKLKPFFDGVEKTNGLWTLRLFRSGHMEFVAKVDDAYSWGQKEEEYKVSPKFNYYAITEIPVSFIRLLKELVQAKGLAKSYSLIMAYGNCSEYILLPHSIPYISKPTLGKGLANMDDWACRTLVRELNMANDEEAYRLIEMLYSNFGYSENEIPFFDEELNFEAKPS